MRYISINVKRAANATRAENRLQSEWQVKPGILHWQHMHAYLGAGKQAVEANIGIDAGHCHRRTAFDWSGGESILQCM